MKYRLDLEIELEPLPAAELEAHAQDMCVDVGELDVAAPSAAWLQQQVEDCLFGHDDVDELLFAGSDIFFRLMAVRSIRSEQVKDKGDAA